ncbi:hypothetical protein PQX77_009441 [Marasmius sp. AFHP31]|nr:hypothetical protein PQX77_009441 [Marasmius sp. AFHP31]
MSYPSDIEYPRRVVVDDTDTRIQYTGTWSPDVGSFDDIGIFGAPYNHTMHGTNSNGASFSFTFEGEFVQVRGAKDNRRYNRPQNTISDDNAALAKWTCQVDGSPIRNTNYRGYMHDVTNLLLCEQGRLSRGQHTLTVNVNIENPDTQTWWLDKVEYVPLPTANLANEVLKIDGSDPSMRYDNGTGNWRSIAGLFNGTGTTGASMNFQFNGTSVSLYGFNEGSDRDWQAGSGRYFVDNSGDTTFEVPASKFLPNTNNRTDWYNQLLFTTPKMEPGSHEMVIAYTGVQKQGEDPTQWFSVDYFYVTASEGGAQLNSTGTTAGSLPERTGTDGSSSNTGAIIGGVVGGVAGLVLIALAICFFLRRRRTKREEQANWEAVPFNPDNMYAAPNAVGSGAAALSPQRNAPSTASGIGSFSSPTSAFSSSYPATSSFYDTYRDSSSHHRAPSLANTGSSAPFDAEGPLRPNRLGLSNPASMPTHDGYIPGVAGPAAGAASISSHSTPLVGNQGGDAKQPQGPETPSQSSQVVERRHQDSGLRYPRQEEVVVDLPPSYTPD